MRHLQVDLGRVPDGAGMGLGSSGGFDAFLAALFS